jgi:hypothetical protein
LTMTKSNVVGETILDLIKSKPLVFEFANVDFLCLMEPKQKISNGKCFSL